MSQILALAAHSSNAGFLATLYIVKIRKISDQNTTRLA